MRKPPTEELRRGLDRLGEGTVVSEVQDKETGEILSGSPQTIKSVLVSRLKPGASSGVQWCATSSTVRVEGSEDVKESDRRDAMAGSVQYGALNPMSHGV